nr:hypothetical protein CFP56_00617 [Quercus suber]
MKCGGMTGGRRSRSICQLIAAHSLAEKTSFAYLYLTCQGADTMSATFVGVAKQAALPIHWIYLRPIGIIRRHHMTMPAVSLCGYADPLPARRQDHNSFKLCR